MSNRQLIALILASALITLDGTATTIALPAIGRDLSASVSGLQWIANAPLLVLAAMLLPAGTLADRYGRIRVMRAGLFGFVAAACACAFARSDAQLIGAKFGQGAAAALVLPAALAVLRGAYADAAERARILGVWAAWTGAASAAGPLLAGALVDLSSWRAIFVPTIAGGVVALLLLEREAPAGSATRPGSVPARATIALMVVLGGLAYLLMLGAASGGLSRWAGLAVALVIVGGTVLARDRHRHVLFPPDLLTARNCVPANATTFALYFGLFGLSFLVVLYVQQLLGYSAMWAAVVVLPLSLMLLLAERFGRLTTSLGTRWLIGAGTLAAASGIGWMAAGSHPLPFWTHIIVGTGLFGLGISLTVSALTHAAVAAVPDRCAGAASGLNHAVVRAAGLVAVALLGSIAAPGVSEAVSAEGVQRALVVCAAVVFVGGAAGIAFLRDEEAGGVAPAKAPAASANS
jgi:MFS family permease